VGRVQGLNLSSNISVRPGWMMLEGGEGTALYANLIYLHVKVEDGSQLAVFLAAAPNVSEFKRAVDVSLVCVLPPPRFSQIRAAKFLCIFFSVLE